MLGGYSYWSLRTGIYGWHAPTARGADPDLPHPRRARRPDRVHRLQAAANRVAAREARRFARRAARRAGVRVARVRDPDEAAAAGAAARRRHRVRRDRAGRPADPAGDRPRSHARAVSLLQAQPLRPRHAGRVGERGGRDPRGSLAESARAREHDPGHRHRRRAGRPRSVDHPARLDLPASAGRARAHCGALRPVHVVLDRDAGRPRDRDAGEHPLLPPDLQLVPDRQRRRDAGRATAARLRADGRRHVRARDEPAEPRRARRAAPAARAARAAPLAPVHGSPLRSPSSP